MFGRQYQLGMPKLRQSLQIAFTLVELLVVMAILAGMLAFTIPNYTQFMVRSKMLAAFNAIRPYQLAMVDYFFSHDDWPSEEGLGVRLGEELVRRQPLLSEAIIYGGPTKDAKIKLTFESPHFTSALEVTLRPVFINQQLEWQCRPSRASLLAGLQRYLPASCTPESLGES